MSQFTDDELKAIAVLVQYAARRCGGGEDTGGAILYTGAFHLLPNEIGAVARLARKIDEHLPAGEAENWAKGGR